MTSKFWLFPVGPCLRSAESATGTWFGLEWVPDGPPKDELPRPTISRWNSLTSAAAGAKGEFL